jgi:hypothetical protein
MSASSGQVVSSLQIAIPMEAKRSGTKEPLSLPAAPCLEWTFEAQADNVATYLTILF